MAINLVGVKVEQRPPSGYIQMGASARYLEAVEVGCPIYPKGYLIYNIGVLLAGLDHCNMHVTRRVAATMDVMRAGWLAELQEAQAADPETDFEGTRRLTHDEEQRISEAARDVKMTMLAEAAGQRAFITRDKRYSIENLLEHVENLMPSGVFNGLPEMAQFDFSEAGRCIAFEVPTAAAFHLMRGTEAVLRDFYCRIVKRKRVSPLLWGPMTVHMRQRRDAPPDVLLTNLDNIRKSFRNPTQHPDAVYDIDGAQDLMSLSTEVVNRMQRHLDAIGK